MSTKKSLVVLAALLGLTTIPAVSFAYQPYPGGYTSFFLGASVFQDTTVTTTQFNPVTVKQAETSFDPGLNIGGTAGYDFGYVRLEGELSYKQGQITSVSEPAFGVHYVNTDGSAGVFAAMVNSFVDIHNDSPVTPYIGGGMGVASVHITNTKGVDSNSGALNLHVFNSDSTGVFAYQVGTGVEVALNRHLSLDLGYRYFATSTASLQKNWPNSTDFRLRTHNATVGLRVKF